MIIENAVMNFDIYEMDLLERRIRIPKLEELYKRKLDNLNSFQNGKDIWKNNFTTMIGM